MPELAHHRYTDYDEDAMNDITPAKLTIPSVSVPGRYSLPRGRLTVTQSLYCQVPGMVPFQLSRGFWRWLATVQQVYSRTITVGEDWVQLPNGWAVSPTGSFANDGSTIGHLVIENDRETITRQPSAPEREAAEAKVIEVGVKTEEAWTIIPVFLIFSGESMRGTPVEVRKLWVRCRRGSAQVTLTMTPE